MAENQNNIPPVRANTDPLTLCVADGRIAVRPLQHYGMPEVITIDLDLLANNIDAQLTEIFQANMRIINEYGSSIGQALQLITQDTTEMVNFICGQVYNRLRTLLEAKCPNERATRMNTRCPIPATQEYPAWISSALSSIGPCRLNDSASDKLVVFATAANRMNNYGRANAVVFNEGRFTRLTGALRAAGVPMAPFPPVHATTPSYYPFLRPNITDGIWGFYGSCHSSHFENEDIARAAFVTDFDTGAYPFEDTTMTIGYVDNKATLDALAAVAAPEGIPAGQTSGSAGRPIAATFNVNYYGIKPAIAATGAAAAVARGAYIVGRGPTRYYTFQYAHSISTVEVRDILRHRILGSAR